MKKLSFAFIAIVSLSLTSCGGGGLAEKAAAKICECSKQTEEAKMAACMEEFEKQFKPEAEKLDDAKKKEFETKIDDLVKKNCPDAMKLK